MTTALLIVDIQALTLPNAASVPAEILLANAARLLARFRSEAEPVYFVISTGTPRGVTSYGRGPTAWPDAGLAIDPAVAPVDGEPILERAGWSAFAAAGLEGALRSDGVDTIVIAGLATSFGIESSARAAYDLGFTVIVAGDSVSDPDPASHERTLTRVVPALGRVRSTQEIIEG